MNSKPNFFSSILVGLTGAGKTTIINQLCDLDRQVGTGGSQTRDIDELLVRHGNAFAIIDTPGTDSDEEAYKHSFLLYHALTTKPVNGIFLVVKYENRYQQMTKKVLDFQMMLPTSCSANMFLIITHWDQAKNPNTEKAEIIKKFSSTGISTGGMIFKQKDTPVLELSAQMFNCLKTTSPIKIQLSKEDFALNFQIIEETKKGYTEYKKIFKQIHQSYNESVTSYLKESKGESTEDQDDFLHFLIVDFKDALSQKLDEFNQKYKSSMVDLEWYALHIKLKKQFVSLCSEFTDSLQEIMGSRLSDPNDPKNLVKRCPKCQEVWVKVEGCDGFTTCGNKVSAFYDTMQQVSAFRYISKWVNGKVKFEKSPRNWKVISKSGSNSKANAKYVGCGAQIEWRSCPRLQESEIKELFNATSIDQVLKIIRDPAFLETTKEYEKQILADIPDALK